MEQEKETILQDLSEGTGSIYFRRFRTIPSDELVKLGFAIMKEPNAPGLLALVHEPDHTVLLFSDGSPERNCGDLVKQLAKPLGGKGGGRPDQARAILPDRDAELTFIQSLMG